MWKNLGKLVLAAVGWEILRRAVSRAVDWAEEKAQDLWRTRGPVATPA